MADAKRGLVWVYDQPWLRALLPSHRCINQMYCAEDALPQALLHRPLHSEGPQAACMFVVPLRFSERSQGNWAGPGKAAYMNASGLMIEGLVSLPSYRRNEGKDHIWILPYSNPLPPPEFLRGVVWLANGDPEWITRQLEPIALPRADAVPLLARTVVIPPAVPPSLVDFWGGTKTAPARDVLASWWGRVKGNNNPDDKYYGDRRRVARLYGLNLSVGLHAQRRLSQAGGQKDYGIVASGPGQVGAELDQAMLYARSRFMLCPRGFALWTPRPVLAVYSGAVPVIIGAEQLMLPLGRTFDWRAFVLRVPSRDISRLEPILRAVPRSHVRALRANALRLRALLRSAPERLAEAIVRETLKIDTVEMHRCRRRAEEPSD